MNILITGAFGFLGTSLSKALKPRLDHHLIAIDLSKPTKHDYNAYYSWDYLESVDWKSIDIVIHLAGKAHDLAQSIDPQSYFDINLGLTKVIFDYFKKSAGSKFILFSSVKAAADTVKGEELQEDDQPNPLTPYGQSKLAAEQYVLSNQDPLIQKKVYILRPCMIHGPGNKGNLNLLFSVVRKGLPWPLGAFENKRSFCSIDNLTFIVEQLIDNNIASGIYQVADDKAMSTNDLIKLIGDCLQKRSIIWKWSPRLIRGVARLGDLLRLPINSERLKKLTESYAVSNDKLKTALCITAMPVSAIEGMKKTIDSFKSLT